MVHGPRSCNGVSRHSKCGDDSPQPYTETQTRTHVRSHSNVPPATQETWLLRRVTYDDSVTRDHYNTIRRLSHRLFLFHFESTMFTGARSDVFRGSKIPACVTRFGATGAAPHWPAHPSHSLGCLQGNSLSSMERSPSALLSMDIHIGHARNRMGYVYLRITLTGSRAAAAKSLYIAYSHF